MALIVSHLLIWAQVIAGGPEGYVRKTDFASALTGALILRDGNGQFLYELETQRAAQARVLAPHAVLRDEEVLPFNHLPFEALAVAPLMDLPYAAVYGVWTLAAALALLVGFRGMMGGLAISGRAAWLTLLGVCSYAPVLWSLMLGQNSAFVLLGLCGTYLAVRDGHSARAGIPLVLVALKLQILPAIILLLILQRSWRTLAAFGLLFAALSTGAMAVLGPEWPFRYGQLLSVLAGWNRPGVLDPAVMANWRGLATGLFGGWAPSLVTPAFLALSGISLTLIVWAAMRGSGVRSQGPELTRADPRSPTPDPQPLPPGWDLLWALAAIVAVLSSYHLNLHDLSLLTFPAIIMASYATGGQGRSRWWLGLVWMGYALAPITLVLLSASPSNSAFVLAPSVLLLAVAAVSIAWEVRQRARPSLPT